MIIKHCKEGWEIVSHYAHGLLAGKIAQHLRTKLRPQFWTDTLTAIIEHDDHLLDFEEKEYISDTGMPLDFTMSGGTDKETLEHARRVYDNSLQKSQLVALLVGRHLAYLYESLANEFAPMKEFLKEIDGHRKRQRSLYDMSKKNEDDSYDLVLFCDRLSLILCQEEIPDTGRMLEINSTIDGKKYFIQQTEKGLNIEPWIFKKNRFQIEHEYRIITEPFFKSNMELRDALETANIGLRRYIIHK